MMKHMTECVIHFSDIQVHKSQKCKHCNEETVTFQNQQKHLFSTETFNQEKFVT